MRCSILAETLVVILLLGACHAVAGEPGPAGLVRKPKKESKKVPIVQEVSVEFDWSKTLKKQDFGEPVIINDAKGLAKALPEMKPGTELKPPVDFDAQDLLLFRWSGSGMDRLAPFEKEKDEKPLIQFKRSHGATRDLRVHLRLFAVRKGVAWEILDDPTWRPGREEGLPPRTKQ